MFDVLELGGTDLRACPYRVQGRAVTAARRGFVPIALVPMTIDATASRAWLTGHLDAGIGEVVAERLNQPYRPRSTWRKVRAYTSTDVIVVGVLRQAGPESLHEEVAQGDGPPATEVFLAPQRLELDTNVMD